MTRAQEIAELQRKIAEAAAQHKSTSILTARLCSLRMCQIEEENEMPGHQDARDAETRLQITNSCRVIKSHASFIGASALEIATMPSAYTPACMDELNEAAGVLQRALGRIERAKELLLSKTHLQAAE